MSNESLHTPLKPPRRNGTPFTIYFSDRLTRTLIAFRESVEYQKPNWYGSGWTYCLPSSLAAS